MNPAHQPSKRIAIVKVSGKDKNLWASTVTKFRGVIKQLLDLQVDPDTGATVRDELADYVRHGSEWVKESLQKPKVENILKLQEAAKLAAERIKIMEEAQGQHIENEAKRFRENLKQMKFFLLLAKGGAFDGESDEDVLMFAKTADAWLFAIAEMEKSTSA